MIKKYWRLICFFGAAYLLGLVIYPPASLMNILLARLGDGWLSVGATSGSFWQGQGQLVVHGQGTAAISLGRISWEISPAQLVLATARISLRQDFEGTAGKLVLSANLLGNIELRQVDVRLPATILSVASPAIAVMDPAGQLDIRSDAFRVTGNRAFSGQAIIDWHTATLLQRDAGSYRLTLTGNGPAIDGDMQTRNGMLILDGKGSWKAGQPLKIDGRAGLAPGDKSVGIMPLFRMICPKGGNECRISRG